ncbi:MAG: FKBP-type peptidyl-prolyl cis-trans isomerase [Nocardiaceae bacterium]|nr:FKBP-type peptidyl-prolyl cis-trans isomerase [Nocardiaceae bacterium]
MRNSSKILIAAAALSTAATLAGCSSSGTSNSATATTVDNRPACKADDVKVTGKLGSRPEITIPDTCAPPKDLVIKDLTEGKGAPVKDGDNVTVQYDLVTWSDKVELDASWNRNEPFTVENVGQASVIDGWNQGLIGLKPGGRRLLIVPPALGYGEGGNGMKANETLVFVIDAVK